jgi:hypothetical protein
MSDKIDGKPDRVESRLENAFDEERAAAESDLRAVPWVSGIPRPEPRKRTGRIQLLPSARFGRLRKRTVVLQVGAVALVAVLVSAGFIVPTLLRSSLTAGPSATESGSPSAAATESSSAIPDATRYSDGIPRTWQGQPVLRGGAALDYAKAASDETSFLVAFWAGIEVPHSCQAQGPGDNSELNCGWMDNVGDQPGVPSYDLEHALRVDTRSVAPGPVIARVHTHDPALEGCTPASVVAACRAIMVGEAIVWSGDQTTAPRPVTVAQAAAAFGVPPTPASLPPCGGENLPGVPILVFHSGSGTGSDGVVAIFPSVSSLAAVAPAAAANGESDAPVGNGNLCGNVRWLARGNVLVGLGPNALIEQARSSLQLLPKS